MSRKLKILGLSRRALHESLCQLDPASPQFFSKPYGFQQFWDHVYVNGTTAVQEMFNLPKSDREKLLEHVEIGLPTVEKELVSQDGTTKWLLGFDAKSKVETVFIPEVNQHGARSPSRKVGTVCVSSQIGCSLRCSFCHTGTQKL
ncbi:hypothetical protein HDU91_006156, partial [Kappamyces sp. JEL0680]